MELHQKLLNSFDYNFKPQGFSYEANKELIEQLLANFAIEIADINAVAATVSGLVSERIKFSILNRLGDYCTDGRFTIQCAERNQSDKPEELIASFKHSLAYKYWHTLSNRLGTSNLDPFRNAPKKEPFLTLYVQEEHYEFNLENVKKFLSLYSENLYNVETLKAECNRVFLDYGVELETLNNGDVKLKMFSGDIYNNFKFEIADLINGALYFTDEEWYLNDQGKMKTGNTDIKGVAWTKFKKSNHVLTMRKDIGDKFEKFYGIE